MYPFCQRAEIAHPLKFVVGQLDVEMLFQSCEQIESLEAVDAQRLEKIIPGIEVFARHVEMRGRQLEDFVRRLIESVHDNILPHRDDSHGK